MNEPVLVIMAAGMGSRYGGLKQMDPVGSAGELIIDFSLYDAYLAGFKEVICVIKREIEEDFKALMAGRADRYLNIRYAFQDLKDLPEGHEVPEGREKPWGTCHAVLSCREMIQGPFAVINADDYYGPGAFQSMYEFLSQAKDDHKYRYCMIGYQIENTLTENGTVARGVCQISGDGFLQEIVERTKIKWMEDGSIGFTEDEGQTWEGLGRGTAVSMNFWGFSRSMIDEMAARFPAFLDRVKEENPLKGEYFLPLAVDALVKEELATVKVLKSADKWYGVTYKEDKDMVVSALQACKDKGLYPEKIWS
ncbi:nucleotidyltransferase [Aminipila butyrica]|uniref:Nucleotidyltransferase n=1 Tax=Aminipila butyrica TaxID=433296 RepID=A0A858BS97_9FIRM|nr:sugar phosphate nucleotidyltransferase [Aminipila butyrica]QIB67985.1 nucleotidyltransferase [Aminipila butyrica]